MWQLYQIDYWSYFYSCLGKINIEASNAVIIGTILVSGRMSSILFIYMTTFLYVYVNFSMVLNLVYDVLNSLMHMSALVGKFMVVTYVYCSFFVLFMGFQNQVYQIILDVLDFDIVMGITWLALYNIVLNCNANNITLAMFGMDKLE